MCRDNARDASYIVTITKSTPSNKSNKPRGGARPNSGPKKGAIYAKTIQKEEARAALRQMVLESMKPLVQAQMANAMGIGHLYTRDKAGKFNKIENPTEIDRLLLEGKENETYWIFAKDPSVQAFTDLLNRALDKPKEQEFEVKLTTPSQLTDAELKAKVGAIALALGVKP